MLSIILTTVTSYQILRTLRKYFTFCYGFIDKLQIPTLHNINPLKHCTQLLNLLTLIVPSSSTSQSVWKIFYMFHIGVIHIISHWFLINSKNSAIIFADGYCLPWHQIYLQRRFIQQCLYFPLLVNQVYQAMKSLQSFLETRRCNIGSIEG